MPRGVGRVATPRKGAAIVLNVAPRGCDPDRRMVAERLYQPTLESVRQHPLPEWRRRCVDAAGIAARETSTTTGLHRDGSPPTGGGDLWLRLGSKT
jgi:hypothetical protein